MRVPIVGLAKVASLGVAGLLGAACQNDAKTLAGPIQAQAALTPSSPAFVRPDSILVAYVANRGSNFVSVLYGGRQVAQIAVGKWPADVHMTPWRMLYVTNQGSNSVSVVNAETNVVEQIIRVGRYPHGIAGEYIGVHPTYRVYVANQLSNTVSVIDPPLGVRWTIPVGDYPYGVAVLGSDVYVANYNSNTVSVIDAGLRKVVATVPVGIRPVKIATNYSYYIYVTNEGSNSVSVIDTRTNSVVVTIPVGVWPNGLAFDRTGFLYVANVYGGSISVIDPLTNRVVQTIRGFTRPIDIDFDRNGLWPDPSKNVAYVTLQESGSVSRFRVNPGGPQLPPTFLANVQVGQVPWGVATETVKDPPWPQRLPQFGSLPGVAEKDFTEVCNSYVDGTHPPLLVHVSGPAGGPLDVTLNEGECRDVWFEPFTFGPAGSMLTIRAEPYLGYYPRCFELTQIGPSDRPTETRGCDYQYGTSALHASNDVGWLVKFDNYKP